MPFDFMRAHPSKSNAGGGGGEGTHVIDPDKNHSDNCSTENCSTGYQPVSFIATDKNFFP